MADLIGSRLGQYQVVEQIGVGGMATVYKAYQPSINRHVAVKVLPGQFARDPNFVKRFEHEAKAIAALEHPHILPVYDFGTKDDLYYMVMRYVPTGTLANLMNRPLPHSRIVQIVGDVARALDYAHKQGVVHRDIKPSNILIDKNGEVLLTDFGIAKLMEGGEGTQLTGTGSILGTPAYMAPEQAKGTAIDRRTDIYSLGVVLYELLAGQPPYQADTALAVVLKHINEPLPMPRSVNPQVPEPLEQVVVKAMAKDPNQRYQTAAEMEQALRAALRQIETVGATGSVARPATQVQSRSTTTGVVQPAKGKGMGPLLIGGILAAALLCLLAGGVGLFMALPGSNGGTPATRVTAEARTTLQVISQPTATPNATSEPEATPTVGVEPVSDNPLEDGVLFRDTFDSDQYCWSDEGTHLFGHYKSEIVDGHFRSGMQAKQGAVLWGFLPSADFTDFVASVEAQPVAGSDPPIGYGLIFRGNPKGDYYLFQVRGDNSYAVYLITHDSDEWQTLINPKISQAVQAGGPNQLTVQAIGPTFTFFINGQEVASLEDQTLPVGYVGLLTEIQEGRNSQVDYDNLEVRLPEGYPPDQGGRILLADCFNSDDNGWTVGTFSDTGFESATTIDGDYTVDLTARQKDGYVYRDAMTVQDFDDFSVAVEATPADSETEYTFGLVFRNTGETFYTFEIGNDGRYGVYLYNNQWKTLAEGNTPSVFSAQGNEVKVVAKGSDLAFFINGDRVANLTDGTTLAGKIGLVTTVLEQDQSASVSFDNLVISQVSLLNMPGSESGLKEETLSSDVLFSDSFDSDAQGWSTGEFEDDYAITEVMIEEGKYTLAATTKKPSYIEKTLPSRRFSDFVLTLEATPRDTETHYSYGVAFREDADYHTYLFEIGNDGLYSVQLYDGEWRKLKDWSSSDVIKPGETNELKVIANGSNLTFFINGEQLTSLQDATLAEGRIGLVMDMFEEGQSATVDFDNLVLKTIDSAE